MAAIKRGSVSRLENLKILFSKLIEVNNDINELHSSIVPPISSYASSSYIVEDKQTIGSTNDQGSRHGDQSAPKTTFAPNYGKKISVVRAEEHVHAGQTMKDYNYPANVFENVSDTRLNGKSVDVHNVRKISSPNKCQQKESVIDGVQSEFGSSCEHVQHSPQTSEISLGTKNMIRENCNDLMFTLNVGATGTYSNESQMMTGICSYGDTTFSERRLERILDEAKPSNTLTNYFYYLFDESDALLVEEPIHRYGLNNGVKTNDDVALIVNMPDYTSYSPDENEIVRPAPIEDSSNRYDLDTGTEMGDDFNSYSPDGAVIVSPEPNENTLFIDVEVEDPPESSISSVDPYWMNVRRGRGCDKSVMLVPTSNMGRYNKKYCCCFCSKQYSKLVRHLETVHKNEDEVKKFLALAVGSKTRRVIIGKLRTKGRSALNADVKLNTGKLSVCRRPNEKYKRTAKDFMECDSCGDSLRSTGLRRHWNKCTGNPLPGVRVVKKFSRLAEGRLLTEASEDLKTVFSKFNEDEEILAIRFDWIIIAYGNDQCINLWRDYQMRVIRSKLRNAGKLLIAAKLICTEITDFASLYHVSKCNALVVAIRNIAGFDTETKEFTSPATASTIVTLVKAIGELLMVEYMKNEDEEREKAVNRFLTVFHAEAKIKINKAVTVTQINRRREKVEVIPSTEDVGKLAEYLDRERGASFDRLSQKFDYEEWMQLVNLTAMSVCVYNRKRVGDTENILLKEFERRQILSTPKTNIPDETKNLIKSKMLVRAKLHRPVPVLLKHHFDECLVLITRHREAAGVSPNNKYLFGLPSKSGEITKIDGCTLFQKYSKACGASDPESLRGTKLRKHLASTCTALDLTDTQINAVAASLGHSGQIHRDIYRQDALHAEVVQMSRIFEIARGSATVDNIRPTANPKISAERKRPQSTAKANRKRQETVKTVASSGPKSTPKAKRKRRETVETVASSGPQSTAKAKRKRQETVETVASSGPQSKKLTRSSVDVIGTNAKAIVKRKRQETVETVGPSGTKVKLHEKKRF